MPTVSIDRIPFILDGFLAASFPDVLIVRQEEGFNPAKQAGVWMRSTCKPGNVEDGEKGPGGWSRRNGLSLIDVYAPSPLPVVEAWRLASRVEKAFRHVCVEGIQIEDPESSNMGVDNSNKYHVRVTVPWWCWTD